MSNPLITLSIPKHTNFRVLTPDSDHVYQCQSDIQFNIKNTSILIKIDGEYFFLCQKLPPLFSEYGIYDPRIRASNNTDIYHVKDVARLDDEAYDITLSLNGMETIECRKFQICVNNQCQFWQAKQSNHMVVYNKIPNPDLSKGFELVYDIDVYMSDVLFSRNVLCLKKNSCVEFGDDDHAFIMASDISITMKRDFISSTSQNCYRMDDPDTDSGVCANSFECGIIAEKQIPPLTKDGYPVGMSTGLFVKKAMKRDFISSTSQNCYRMDDLDTDSGVCANPFEYGIIAEKKIPLLTKDGHPVEISTDLFVKKITKCCFYSKHLHVNYKAESLKYPSYARQYLPKNDGIIPWCKKKSQQNYCRYLLNKKCQHLTDNADSVIANTAKYLLENQPIVWKFFLDRAFTIALRSDDMDLIKNLFAADHGDLNINFVKTAVEYGKLAISEYLIGLNGTLINEEMLHLAVKSGHVAVAKYLIAQGVVVGDTWYHYLKIAIQNKDQCMIDYLQSLRVNSDYYKKMISAEIAAINSSFEGIQQLMKAYDHA